MQPTIEPVSRLIEQFKGAGLGDKFLGHVERCSVLLHLIDATLDDPKAAYRTIREELKGYGRGLARKKEIVALNKVDALSPEEAEAKRAALSKAIRKPVLALSAAAKQGVDPVLRALMKAVQAERAKRRDEVEEEEAAQEATEAPSHWTP